MIRYTLHPFGDEWLWDSTGEAPLLCRSMAQAVAVLASHRRHLRVNAALGDALADLARDVWAEVRDHQTGLRVGYIDTADVFHKGKPAVTCEGTLR